ncbi:MAG: hypothetical protein K0U78_01920 [Actinomycetia bacterium]|nr:hypothetical protein [Actinomycetes bacterium]
MSRRKPRWRRPISKPAVRVALPIKVVVEQDPELVDRMKRVAQDVVLVMNGLDAQYNSGAF